MSAERRRKGLRRPLRHKRPAPIDQQIKQHFQHNLSQQPIHSQFPTNKGASTSLYSTCILRGIWEYVDFVGRERGGSRPWRKCSYGRLVCQRPHILAPAPFTSWLSYAHATSQEDALTGVSCAFSLIVSLSSARFTTLIQVARCITRRFITQTSIRFPRILYHRTTLAFLAASLYRAFAGFEAGRTVGTKAGSCRN